jgi:3-oxoadipate enol-lactonase
VLAFDERGAGPAVLLLHAGIADRSMWSEHLATLAGAGHRVVALDLPGFGESLPDPREPWECVLEAMDELSLERVALIGNSFGAAIALRIAAIAPERVTALMSISAPVPGIEPSAELRAVWDAEEAALEDDDIEGAVDAVLKGWLLPDRPDELARRIGDMQRRAIELLAGGEDPGEQARDPLEDDLGPLAGFSAPAVAAAGELDMTDFLDGCEVIAAAIDGTRCVVFDGVRHLAPMEAPAAFLELALEMLAAVPAG